MRERLPTLFFYPSTLAPYSQYLVNLFLSKTGLKDLVVSEILILVLGRKLDPRHRDVACT